MPTLSDVSRWAAALTERRAQLQGRPFAVAAWKIGVGVVGGVVIAAGVVMLVLPGQGLATIVVGLAILSTEFRWAARLRHRVVGAVRVTGRWLGRQPRWIRAAAWLGFAAVLVLLGYATLIVTGVPRWLPGWLSNPLTSLPLVRG